MVQSALDLYKNKKLWHEVCITAMKQELGWETSAAKYRKLYQAEVDAKQ
jgi:glycogen synthase